MKKMTLCILVLGVLGCTQKFKDVSATVYEAYNNQIDIELTEQQIREIPYASAYLKINDQKKIFVVLAFAEENPKTGIIQLKWVSQNHSMIVTEQGRVVKTIGLDGNNLVNISNNLPTLSIANASRMNPSDHHATYDWMPNYLYNFTGIIQQKVGQTKELKTPLYSSKVTLIEEKVTFTSLNKTITNKYWVDKNDRVKSSIQYLGPDMATIEFTILKDFF